MRPAAHLQSAIELLDEIIIAARDNGPSADALAKRFFAARRYAGSKDRRFIRDLTWQAIRQFGECPVDARAAFVAMSDSNEDLSNLFDGSGYGPEAISESEPRAKGGAIPQWIRPYLSDLLDEPEIAALLERAPLDLRVNTLKANRSAVLQELPDAAPMDQSPNALRLPTGYSADKHPAYQNGRVDVQDLGSQLIAQACHAQPNMTVLDLCAGAGGKTLALAADMQGKGRLIASDTNRNRLDQLLPRARLAAAGNIETRLLNPGQEKAMLDDLAGKCDLVLIDAPCSGSGTWRRNPETRWRLNEARLDRVIQEQAKLLSIAAEMVAPNGCMVYAVCSLLDAEGRNQVEQLLQSHNGWKSIDPKISAGRSLGAKGQSGVMLTPYYDTTDGFFMARLEKL
jgi:16S rRNA (cytosine967-C5)-methyltransferase